MGIFKLNGIDYMGGGGGGGNANEEVLTWAEYCALTEEEKANGTTYYITDINGEGKDGFQPVIYSTEEREIGVWTDGKPLYQRTLFYTGDTIITVSANSSSTYSATGITDIYVNDILPTLDQLIHYQIDLTFDGNEKNIYQFEYCFQASTGTFIRSHNPGIDYIGYNIIPGSSITLQYTKTTDQPGSGIWTPQGVPAVHYSTDEQIVGTWIDGSTVYEKTLKFISPNVTGDDSTSDLVHGVSNIDEAWVETALYKSVNQGIPRYQNIICSTKFAASDNTSDISTWEVGDRSIYSLTTSYSSIAGREFVFVIRYTKTT